MKIILAIIIFSAIVLFHELGHFLFAKKCGVKVNEFCLGLGPTLISWGKGETKYCLNLIPFGGACVMEGEDESSGDDRAFNSKTAWERFQIIVAGPLFNLILAYILGCIYIAMIGYDAPVIYKVNEGSPAYEAGLTEKDEIIKINGYNLHFYQELSFYNFFNKGETETITYFRDGSKNSVTLTPRYDEETGRYMIGIYSLRERKKCHGLEVMAYGAYEVKCQVFVTIQSLKMLVSGQVGLENMSGPVGIVDTIGDVYEASAPSGVFYVVVNMLSIAILLSANLAVMNLIPFPALDGGRIFLILIELIRRKKLDPELEGKINFAGFAVLMAFMIFVMCNDITKLIK